MPIWLGERTSTADRLLGILQPYPKSLMHAYPLNRRVGNVRTNDAERLDGTAVAV
jgi:putative SOS response-associated peptidase YedK